MSDECLFEVNERSSWVLTAAFFDEDKVPVTPTAGTYRIDDPASRTEILDTTALPSLDESVDIPITSEQNRIIRSRSKSEIRLVTVQYDYGDDGHGTAEYRYKVLNLYGVTTP